MKKKCLAVCLALVLIMGLVGCSRRSEKPQNSSAPAQKPSASVSDDREDQNDSFEAGNRYTMSVILGAKGKYRFATENGKSAVKATINGFQAENISHEGNEDESRYLKLKYTFTCLPADSIGGGAFG